MTTSLGWALPCLATVLAFSAEPIFAGPILEAHGAVSTGPTVWTYTVFNDQAPGDPNYISSFVLEVAAPVFAITAPDGWISITDNISYVQWFNTDPTLPYPHDIAPGASLGGFSLSSTMAFSEMLSYGLSGWDHTLDEPGPSVSGTI